MGASQLPTRNSQLKTPNSPSGSPVTCGGKPSRSTGSPTPNSQLPFGFTSYLRRETLPQYWFTNSQLPTPNS
ncbi:MAG: hypothetical protein ACHBN1_16510 [Heteroscytonema crispum UTEX LB 1556]